jgi:FkbM family methyltransferase
VIGPLLRIGAAAPPIAKSNLWLRVFRRLSRGVSGTVASNLGIDRRLRWDVPLIAPVEAFGCPIEEPTERGALAVAGAFASPGIDFLDIGANRGIHVVALAGSYRRVIAVEPDPELAAALRRNLARNAFPNVDVVEAAISDHVGKASFLRNLDNPLMGSLEPDFAPEHRHAEIAVDLLTIAELVEREGVDRFVAKIDVEGHGMAAVRGLGPALDRCEALIVEITANEVRDGLAPHLVRDRGLHAYYIVDRVLKPSPSGEVNYESPFLNWLFCRLDAEALRARVHACGLTVAAAH